MSAQTQPLLPFIDQRVRAKRERKMHRIEKFFAANLGKRFTTGYLHLQFGPAFRSRKSEIMRDDERTIDIFQATDIKNDGSEHSVFWAEKRDEKEA